MPVCVSYSSKFSPKSASISYTDSFSSEFATASTHLMLELSALLRLKNNRMKNGAFSAHLSSFQHYPWRPVCTQEGRKDTELEEERKAEEGPFSGLFFFFRDC